MKSFSFCMYCHSTQPWNASTSIGQASIQPYLLFWKITHLSPFLLDFTIVSLLPQTSDWASISYPKKSFVWMKFHTSSYESYIGKLLRNQYHSPGFPVNVTFHRATLYAFASGHHISGDSHIPVKVQNVLLEHKLKMPVTPVSKSCLNLLALNCIDGVH